MCRIISHLGVFFEDPFWVGIIEKIEDGQMSVAKVTFGAEPKDYEVWDYVLRNYDKLRFSPSIETVVKETSRNPKRMQRQVRKQILNTGIGTKSQQALKLQQEARIVERKTYNREQKEAEMQRQFELRQQKKKEKHRGR